MGSGWVRVPEALAGRGGERPLPTFDVPYFKYIDEEDEEDEWSSRSQSSTEDDSGDSLLSDRYVVVSGTPEKILEHLLSDLHLEAAQDKETGKERGGGGDRGSACPRPGVEERSQCWCRQSGAARRSLPGTYSQKPASSLVLNLGQREEETERAAVGRRQSGAPGLGAGMSVISEAAEEPHVLRT